MQNHSHSYILSFIVEVCSSPNTTYLHVFLMKKLSRNLFYVFLPGYLDFCNLYTFELLYLLAMLQVS